MAQRWLAKKTVGQLFRQGCHEIPEVMGAAVFGILGAAGIIYSVIKESRTPGHLWKKYKKSYVVYRDTDHLVKYLHVRDTPEQLQEYEDDSKLYLKSKYNNI